MIMDYLEIEKVVGREILDSRGNPTVEAEVTLADGTVARGTDRAVLLLVSSRHLNFVTEIRAAILGRALQRQLRISIQLLTIPSLVWMLLIFMQLIRQ